jgi:hypothetical protein
VIEARELEIYIRAVRQGRRRSRRRRLKPLAAVLLGGIAATLAMRYSQDHLPPQLSVEAATDFGGEVVGRASAAHTVAIRNAGTAPVGLGRVTLAGNAADFPLVSDTCSNTGLDPAGACTVSVQFTPRAAGARQASFSIAGVEGDRPRVALTGTGIVGKSRIAVEFQPPELIVQQRPGTPKGIHAILVKNTGQDLLPVGSVSIARNQDPDFAVARENCTASPIAPGDSCSIEISFAPDGTGPHSSALVVGYAGPDSPRSVPLRGTVESFHVETVVKPASGKSENPPPGKSRQAPAKPEVPPGAPEGQGVIYRNIGQEPVTIGSVSVSGENPSDFRIVEDKCSGSVLQSGATCEVAVDFRPTAAGPRTAVLVVTHNAPDSPRRFPLHGGDATGARPH